MALDVRADELVSYLKELETGGMPNNPLSWGHWQRYQSGILYTAGGWSEQPKWYCEDMNYIGLKMELAEIPYRLAKYQDIISDINGRAQ